MLAFAAACDDDSPTTPSPETITFMAQLAPANEVPPVTNAEASGSGTATILLHLNRDSSNAVTSATADFQVTLAGFPSGTALTMAHIHSAPVGVNGDIVVDTGLTAGTVLLTTGSGNFTRDGISVTPTLAQQILNAPANFYFNVHSVLNGSGMVRGQLVRQ
jgi:hypothetical protein